MQKTTKKVIGILLITSMVMSLYGCSGNNTEIENEKTETESEEKVHEDVQSYVFVKNDGSFDKVYIGSEIEEGEVSKENNPVDFKIKYELDGKEISGNELNGASGHLKVIYCVSKKVKAPIIVATAVALDSSCIQNAKIDNGKIIEKDDKTIIIGYAIPGIGDMFDWDAFKIDNPLSETFIWEGDVKNYSQTLSYSVAIPYKNSELKDKINEKSDELAEKSDELIEGVDKLDKGADKIYVGTKDLSDGAKDLKEGIYKENDAISKLNTGSSDLYKGIKEADTGVDKLVKGSQQLCNGYEGNNGLSKGVKDLSDGIDACEKGVTTLVNTMSSTPKTIQTSIDGIMSQVTALSGIKTYDELSKTITLIDKAIVANEDKAPIKTILKQATGGKITSYATYSKLVTAKDSIDALSQTKSTISASLVANQTNVKKLTDGMSSLNTGAKAIKGGVKKLKNGTKELNKGLNSLKTGTTKLKNGGLKVSNGLSQLNTASAKVYDGAKKLSDGSIKLKDGAKELSDGTGKLKKEIEKLNDMLDAISDASDTVVDLLEEGESYQGEYVIYRMAGTNE